MKMRCFLALHLLIFCLTAKAVGPYDQPAALGAQWLASQQNADGSWGASSAIQPVYTSAAVRALAAAYKQQNAFFAGVTWLENNDIHNVDLLSRQADALVSHGDDPSFAQAYLQSAQASSAGWGLSAFYTSSTIDTALALIAYADLGGGSAQTQPAINFLKGSVLSGNNNQGWAVNNAVNSDPAITALVIQALSRYTTQDAALPAIISSGLTTLNALVTTATPPATQALAAQAAQAAGNTALTTTFLTMLTAGQSTSGTSLGSWNSDPYTTALATSALATAANASSLSTRVDMPDQALRQAVNSALGHNAMENITQGQLAQLISLTAVGAGISDLTGLQYATHLTSLNLNNNNLTSIATLASLTQLAASSITWTGNPGNPGAPVQVPAMPLPAQLLLALGLFAMMTHFHRSSAYKGNF